MFPQVIRYREPIEIKLQQYNTLLVHFLKGGVEAYTLEMEHDSYEEARLAFTILPLGIDVDAGSSGQPLGPQP